MKEQESKYAKVIADLNRSRLLLNAFPLAETLQKLSISQSNNDSKAKVTNHVLNGMSWIN
jgi:hypothetical protein